MRIALFFLLLGLCFGYALWRGGTPERIVAAGFLTAAVATRLLLLGSDRPFSEESRLLLAIDVSLLALLVGLALMSDRWWPLWMGALQLLEVAIQLVIVFDVEYLRWTFAILHGVWSYPMLALLVVATWRHRRRVRRNGADPSWSSSSVRSLNRMRARLRIG